MEKFLTVAKILKPQGVRGEVKVLALTDSPQDLSAFDRVYIGGNPYKLLRVRPTEGDFAVLTLSGVADRNAAELLRGQEIEADRADAPLLPENTYYIVDVIGCEVVDENGRSYGKVADIADAAKTGQSVYTLAGEKEIIFVAVEGVIQNIDIEKKLVTVNSSRFFEVALGI